MFRLGEVCEAIVQALVPRNGDAGAMRIAMQEALWETFAGGAAFDPAAVRPAGLVTV